MVACRFAVGSADEGRRLDDIIKRRSVEKTVNLNELDMDLREPVEPKFRISQMGLGYDETADQVILVAEELIILPDDQDPDLPPPDDIEPEVVRFWGNREQYRALAIHTLQIVDQGRPDPQHNGYTIYYWV